MRKKNLIREIRLLAESIPEGKTYEFECPECMAKHEKKFYITIEQGTIKYCCLRASCNLRGTLDGENSISRREELDYKIPLQQKRNVYDRKPSHSFTPSQTEQIRSLLKYGRGVELWGKNCLNYVPSNNCIEIPIFDLNVSAIEGYQYKQLPADLRTSEWVDDLKNGRGKYTKCYTVYEHDPSYLYLPLTSKISGTMTVCEGPLDAINLSLVSDSIALLGTNFKEETAVKLHEMGVRSLIWMLDADATNKAVKYADQYSFLFRSRVIPMKQDPKNTPEEELKRLI